MDHIPYLLILLQMDFIQISLILIRYFFLTYHSLHFIILLALNHQEVSINYGHLIIVIMNIQYFRKFHPKQLLNQENAYIHITKIYLIYPKY